MVSGSAHFIWATMYEEDALRRPQKALAGVIQTRQTKRQDCTTKANVPRAICYRDEELRGTENVVASSRAAAATADDRHS